MSTVSRHYRVLFIFVALSFILYGNSIAGQFVLDDVSVVQNPTIQNISGAIKAFTSPYYYARPQSGLYRPLTLASFAISNYLSDKPAISHIINIILHALVCFLIFVLILTLKNTLTAWLGSLIFMFLPIHVESVASIVGRAELLALLFSLLALIASLKNKYWLSSLWFLLALFSKEVSIAFLIIWTYIELVHKKQAIRTIDLLPNNLSTAISEFRLRLVKNLSKYQPIFLKIFDFVSLKILKFRYESYWATGLIIRKFVIFVPVIAGYSILRLIALGREYFLNAGGYSFFNPIRDANFFQGLSTALKVLTIYAQKVIFPTYFLSDYSYNQIPIVTNIWNSWQTWLGAVLLGGLIYFCFKYRLGIIGFGCVIFLSSYFIVSNLVFKIGTIMAERLMYMPSLGFAVIAGEIFSVSFIRFKKYKNILTGAFIVLLLTYGVQTIKGNRLWSDEKTLFENAYKHGPNSVVNITNMASLLYKDGKSKEALEKLTSALVIEPKNAPALHLQGQIQMNLNNADKAVESWENAISVQPDYLYPYLSLGAYYYRNGNFINGENILKKAPTNRPLTNIATLLSLNQIGLDKYQEAINVVETSFGKNPKEEELQFVLGIAYLKSGSENIARELLLRFKDPNLSEQEYFKSLKETKIFNIEI